MQVGNVRPIKIEDEMRSSYLDYAMSVIVSRALPDVRDGLKPVHRRILYAMEDLSLRHNAAYKKSARIVGEVLGKYHPHGDAPVYDAMVRMAQDFSMRYPLIDGQGNFGSVDDDPPAAMRYTEARMTEIAEELLADIEKNTVDFAPNFDGSLQEPTVLPSRIPNLLVNGTAGIAVGMATSIPPHNMGEVCDGIIKLIDNSEATVDELMESISAPDFPTAGIILGREGIQSAYSTGRGRIVVRAKAMVEEMRGGRLRIVVTELPFQVNKAALIEKMADLVKDRRIEGISELRDESDRQGMRIVIELRRDCQPRQVLNNLFKHTAMQSAFYVNMLALVQGQPRVLTLKGLLQHHIDHRRDIITRRSQFDLQKAKDRAHILEGLIKALDNLDAVISTIRRSQTAETARTNLMRGFGLTEIQAQAILDMQLRRLAALERKKITDEYTEVLKTIAYLEDLLANPKKMLHLIKEEVIDLKKKYGDPRRTIVTDQEVTEFQAEDLIPHQEVVVILTQRGYIKRLPTDVYRPQRRGGRGVAGVVTREADAARQLLIADTHDSLLLFSNRGKVYHLKAREVPDASRQAKGIPLINLITIDQGEQITAIVGVPDFGASYFMVMATRLGEIKKTALSEFAAVRANGLIAMDLAPKDELVGAKQVHNEDEVILVSQQAKAIRFPVKALRAASRTSGGVRAMRLAPGDHVVALDAVQPNASLLTVTANGFGKQTPLSEYPTHRHGGGGVVTFKLISKTSSVAAARVVHPGQELMLISSDGIVIRTPLDGIASQGRATQGVSVMRLGKGDSVACINCLNGADLRAKLAARPSGQAPDSSPAKESKSSKGAAGKAAPKKPATAKTRGSATSPRKTTSLT